MKNCKTPLTIVGVIVAICASQLCFAQDALTYNAYVGNSQALWKRAIAQNQNDKFSLAVAHYGMLNATMVDQDENVFEEYYDITLELLEELEEEGVRPAESKALRSSVYGFAIAYDSWKGMYLGPKSGSLIKEAYHENPKSPLVIKLYAASKLYTPETFGGNSETALEHFQQAISMFEAVGDTSINWLYLDALAHLGITYKKLGKIEEAIAAYDKALAIEPEFAWVKYSLLPSAQKELVSK